MLNIFTLSNGRLLKIQPDEIPARKPIWADTIAPVAKDLRVFQHFRLRSHGQPDLVLANIAHAEHLNGRIRRNLMDTRRAISFLMRSKLLTPELAGTGLGKRLSVHLVIDGNIHRAAALAVLSQGLVEIRKISAVSG